MKLESKHLFLLFLGTLSLSGLLIATKHLGLASKIINLLFWILTAAVILYIKEIKKEK